MSVSDVTKSIMAAWMVLMMVAIIDARIIPEQRKDTKEYCSTDAFDVTCGEHEVIVMTSALYGRMQPGRCISADYHHTMGCFTDVLTFMDSKCSGRRSCMVVVGALELVAQPCQKDFKAYLEASYKCVPVLQASPEVCQSVETVPVSPANVAFGRSTLTSAGEAAMTCSWEVNVDAGQQVALVLSAFPEPINIRSPDATAPAQSAPIVPAHHADPADCPWTAIVHEGDKVTHVPLCPGDDREREMYTSTGSKVTISFSGNGDMKAIPHFLLRHKAVGCPDIEAPKKSWVKRDKDNLVMKCNETGETWYLTCRHGQWIGDVGNCTSGSSALPASRVFNQSSIFQEGVIFAVIVGIVLGLLIGTSMLGVVFFCRKRWMNGSQGSLQSASDAADQRPATLKTTYPALLRQEKHMGGNMCEYTHVWEVRPTHMGGTGGCKKDIDGQKLDDCYISSAALVGTDGTAAPANGATTVSVVGGTNGSSMPGICTQSMMGNHGIYETAKGRPCEKHQLCLKHDTPLYFELDAEGKRTCAV